MTATPLTRLPAAPSLGGGSITQGSVDVGEGAGGGEGGAFGAHPPRTQPSVEQRSTNEIDIDLFRMTTGATVGLVRTESHSRNIECVEANPVVENSSGHRLRSCTTHLAERATRTV